MKACSKERQSLGVRYEQETKNQRSESLNWFVSELEGHEISYIPHCNAKCSSRNWVVKSLTSCIVVEKRSEQDDKKLCLLRTADGSGKLVHPNEINCKYGFDVGTHGSHAVEESPSCTLNTDW